MLRSVCLHLQLTHLFTFCEPHSPICSVSFLGCVALSTQCSPMANQSDHQAGSKPAPTSDDDDDLIIVMEPVRKWLSASVPQNSVRILQVPPDTTVAHLARYLQIPIKIPNSTAANSSSTHSAPEVTHPFRIYMRIDNEKFSFLHNSLTLTQVMDLMEKMDRVRYARGQGQSKKLIRLSYTYDPDLARYIPQGKLPLPPNESSPTMIR